VKEETKTGLSLGWDFGWGFSEFLGGFIQKTWWVFSHICLNISTLELFTSA